MNRFQFVLNATFLLSIILFSSCTDNPVENVTPTCTITDISPKSGQPGTSVTITGSGFSAVVTDNVVSFNGVTAVVTSATPTKLTVTAPSGGSSGTLSVNVNGKITTGPPFEYSNEEPIETSRKYDVYAFGQIGTVATYWKNGEPVSLGNGLVTSLVVSGSDIYAVGREIFEDPVTGTSEYAKYWKNGVVVPLSDGSTEGYASEIAVSGSDVYIVGYERNLVAKYWKNGVPTLLSDDSWNGAAWDVTIQGSDVYITGFESGYDTGLESGYDSVFARYWKNGVPQVVPRNTKHGNYHDITTSGQDIYIAGSEYNNNDIEVAKFWRNGTETVLSDGIKPATVWSIFISASDVYVSGEENNTAVYWKNGVLTPLITNNLGNQSYSSTISVNKGDVIVSGHVLDKAYNRWASCLWINGELQAPFLGTDPTLSVAGIVVVDR